MYPFSGIPDHAFIPFYVDPYPALISIVVHCICDQIGKGFFYQPFVSVYEEVHAAAHIHLDLFFFKTGAVRSDDLLKHLPD